MRIVPDQVSFEVRRNPVVVLEEVCAVVDSCRVIRRESGEGVRITHGTWPNGPGVVALFRRGRIPELALIGPVPWDDFVSESGVDEIICIHLPEAKPGNDRKWRHDHPSGSQETALARSRKVERIIHLGSERVLEKRRGLRLN